MNIVHFPDPKVHPPWKLLVEHFGDVAYDTLLSHDDLAAAMDMKSLPGMSAKERLGYYNQVGRFRYYMLTDRNVYFETIPKQGYRAVKPGEQSRHAMTKARHGVRRLRDAHRITTNIDTKRLSDKEVAENAMVQARIGGVFVAAQKDMRDLRKALGVGKRQEKPAQIPLPGAVM